jgi:hypothetical protein
MEKGRCVYWDEPMMQAEGLYLRLADISKEKTMQTREYQKKKRTVEKFIRKTGKVEHSVILNEVDVDYDTLMKILKDLRSEGMIK